MGTTRNRLLAAVAVTALAGSLAACGGDSGGGASNKADRSEAVKGGTLNYYFAGTIDHLDPQRVYVGVDIANLNKTVYRSLVAFPAGEEDPEKGTELIPDLATDTGKATDDGKTWTFTLKDGIKWQDGKAITCDDFKYGVSRTFAVDTITGGPNYIINYLDVSSDYKGPYGNDSSAAAKASFDKAITCDGNTITYKFKKPWVDFGLAVASLPALGPYRADQDKGDKSNFSIFSNGPYMLKGTWNPDKGGTLVRNPNYDAATDDKRIREANPDEIDFQYGFDPETNVAVKKIIEDQGADANAITVSNITPDLFPKITGAVADRAINLPSPYSNYLVPNFKRLKDPAVREALAAATNKAAFAQALGGDQVAKITSTIVNPQVPGYQENPAFEGDGKGDVDKAKKILSDAGIKTPVKIKLTYPLGSNARNNAFAALKDTYDSAGFDVTLDGLDPATSYYPTIQNPGSDSDLIYGGWGADWPSISTVIPPLFDARINLTSKTSNGQDYGNYDSDELNGLIDQAASATDVDAANKIYQQADELLGKDVAYIPLFVPQNYFIRGSNIENYVTAVGTSGYPDLGVISLKDGK